MKILAIIIAYKNNATLNECINSLAAINLNLKIVVVDNFGDVLKSEKYEIIKTTKNIGFASGVNLALKHEHFKKYDCIWLLNPDTIVEQNSKFEKENWQNMPDIFSPVIYEKNNDIWFANGKLNRITGEPVIIKGTDSINKGEQQQAEWVSGCSMFIKKQVLEKIGLVDENFFLFYEDIDYCLRAKKAGFKIGVINCGLKVTHKVSQSIDKLGQKTKYEIEQKSKMYFLRKHFFEFLPSAIVISWIRSVKHKLLKI